MNINWFDISGDYSLSVRLISPDDAGSEFETGEETTDVLTIEEGRYLESSNKISFSLSIS